MQKYARFFLSLYKITIYGWQRFNLVFLLKKFDLILACLIHWLEQIFFFKRMFNFEFLFYLTQYSLSFLIMFSTFVLFVKI